MKVTPEEITLPTGWTAEYITTQPGECIALEAPKPQGGFVTIDFKNRVFAGGYNTPRAPQLESKKKLCRSQLEKRNRERRCNVAHISNEIKENHDLRMPQPPTIQELI